MTEVKRQRSTRISSKNQVTVPAAEMTAAGLRPGDRLIAKADGPGRVLLEIEDDPLDELAGALSGIYEKGYLRKLRAEWE